jgi:monoamine oxidase
MLLERAGFQVQLFEARDRVGGRLHTVDEGGGVVYEAGGEWIDSDHYRCLELLREFDLEPIRPRPWPRRLMHKGSVSTEAHIWNDALEDDLRVEAAARELCRDLSSPPWRNCNKAALDARNLADFLNEHTQTERGLWYVTAKLRSDEGEDPDRIGLLGWLAGYMHYLERDGDVMSAYRVPGGFGGLCNRMLGRLRAAPRLGSPLTRVRQDPLGITLMFENGQARVDRLILTLPPTALEQVVFDPALPVNKRCAIEACRMGRTIKLMWEFESPWWEGEEWGGSMLCDGPLQQTWVEACEAPVMCAYVAGDRAMEWARMGDPVKAGVYELSKLHKNAPKEFKRGWAHLWPCDPYAGGGFSHLAPKYVLEHMEHIAPPVARIHFAGEHTGLWTGFIEGALESAERVTQEILSTES